MVKALLLLGNKYDVEDLREEAIQCLQRQYPTDIGEWDKLSESGSPYIIYKEDLLHVEVANLTRRICMPEFHLPALYQCCMVDGGRLLQGSAQLLDDEGQHASLDASDISRCTHAVEKLGELHLKNVSDLFEVTPCDIYDEFYCSTPHRCIPALQNVQYHHTSSQALEVVAGGTGALDPHKQKISKIFGDACQRCVEFYHRRYAESRQVLRDNLAKYFVIPQ